MKKILLSTVLLTTAFLFAGTPPLSSEFLKHIDGAVGLMDRVKIANTLWLIQEIKHIHKGQVKFNTQGEVDPMVKHQGNQNPLKQLTFKGKTLSLVDFIEMEKKVAQLSKADKAEFETIFKHMKNYFEKVNNILLADAHGTEHFMRELIKEFAQKRNKPNTLLLNWNKGDEISSIRENVKSFKILYDLSHDLMLFLQDLIKSCPKALKEYQEYAKTHQHHGPHTSA